MTETTQKSKLFAPKNLMHDFVRLTGSPAYLWFRPKLYYTSERARERIRGGALLIANHVGFVDPVLLLCAVPYRRQFFIVSEELMDAARTIALEAIEKSLNASHTDWAEIKNSVKDSLSKYLYQKTHRKPMILPVIMNI